MTLPTLPEDQRPPESKKNQDFGGLYHGMQFAMTALLGMGAGYWLDQRYLPAPLGTLGGLFIGAAVGMYVLAKALK